MASQTNPSQSPSLESLISSRNQNLAFFLPFILGSTNTRPESDPDQDSPDHPRPGSPLDQILLVNPGMVVLDGGSLGLDSLLRGFMRKDGQPPASKASIEAMPSVEVRSGDEVESVGRECVICLEEWGVGDVAREMPCKHWFHGGCVEKWLKIHGTCPVCRFRMPVDEEDQDLDKKIGEESQIWLSFSISLGRFSEEQRLNQASRE